MVSILPLIHLGALFVFGSTFRFLEHFSVLAENCRQWNKPECKVTLPIVQSSVPNWVSDHNPVTPSPKPSPQEEEAEGGGEKKKEAEEEEGSRRRRRRSGRRGRSRRNIFASIFSYDDMSTCACIVRHASLLWLHWSFGMWPNAQGASVAYTCITGWSLREHLCHWCDQDLRRWSRLFDKKKIAPRRRCVHGPRPKNG